MNEKKKKALVLSGGSIKGAFQAGAVKAVLESGFEPDFIYGISAGALNGSFLCNEEGKQVLDGKKTNWNQIGGNLANFWLNNVRKPSDVIKPRWAPTIVKDVLFNSFDGLVNPTPYHDLVKKTIRMENLYASPVLLKIGTVNMIDGTLIIADPSFPEFIDYLLASSSVPIMMPVMNMNRHPMADGGVREIAPLKPAIENGATDIIVIACQPKKMGGAKLDTGNLLQMIERTFDILTNAIVDDDMALAEFINRKVAGEEVPEGEVRSFNHYRKINIIPIRPNTAINVDIGSFTSKDIRSMIETGYETARQALQSGDQ